jgi:hypothetical protein
MTIIRVEIGEFPSNGFCQMCGKANSAANKSNNTVHFFCSSACSGNYYKAMIFGQMFGAGNLGLQWLSPENTAAAASATSYCWSCGAAIKPMTKEMCGSCGAEQEIKL